MVRHYVEPREAAGTHCHLPDGFEPNRFGEGIRLLQIEFDIFKDHSCVSDEIINLSKHDDKIVRVKYFDAVKRTVHGTAVASIISSPIFGIAPAVNHLFKGVPTYHLSQTESFMRTIGDIHFNPSKFGIERGDVVSISIQTQRSIWNGRRQLLISAPLDLDEAFAKFAERISELHGISIFIAAGNGKRDLGQVMLKPALSPAQSKLFPEQGEPYKYQPDSRRKGAFLVGALNNQWDSRRAAIHKESNFGYPVELYAPGKNIKAACFYHKGSNSGTLYSHDLPGFTKTSAATPIAAASIAAFQSYLKSIGDNPLDPNDLRNLFQRIKDRAPSEYCFGQGVVPRIEVLVRAYFGDL